MRRAALVIALAATVAAAACAAPAFAGKRGVETFAGQCSFAGEVAFSPSLTAADRPTEAVARAHGTCTGSLTHRDHTTRLGSAPARYRATSQGSQSCAAASAGGRGHLLIAGRKIHFTFDELRVLVIAPLELTGRRGGAFAGQAIAAGDPLETVGACAGAGLESSPLEISGRTRGSITG